MRLENIGFYTLSDERARTASGTSPMQRCEVLITGVCNFKCPYCRGPREGAEGHISMESAFAIIDAWANDGLVNIRFSGGEPTTHPGLKEMVHYAKSRGIQRVAISTNGSMARRVYDELLEAGVYDFSISLDACCSSKADTMAGVDGAFQRVVDNIRYLSGKAYVTVGVVLTDTNIDEVNETIRFAHSLGVADIRIISAAQDNHSLAERVEVEEDILNAHPILKYRIENIREGRHVRGLRDTDDGTCWLAQDDSVIVGDFHYPCVIHMRERGQPIGRVGPNMRQERVEWLKNHNSHTDPICKKNCLDVCIDYNNRCGQFRRG